MKDADKATEKRLKSALDAAESQEASAREGANRLVRRVTDAQRGLESGKSRSRRTVRRPQHGRPWKRRTPQRPTRGVRRNPAQPVCELRRIQSVRGTELENDISDAAEQLRTAQEQLPRLTAELDQSIADAEAVVAEANNLSKKPALRSATSQMPPPKLATL